MLSVIFRIKYMEFGRVRHVQLTGVCFEPMFPAWVTLLVILRFNIQPRSTQQAATQQSLHGHVDSPLLFVLDLQVLQVLWRSWYTQLCFCGRLVHNSSEHEREHNHWSHGTQDPTVIPVARGKKRNRHLDLALRTWLRGALNRCRDTTWAPRG